MAKDLTERCDPSGTCGAGEDPCNYYDYRAKLIQELGMAPEKHTKDGQYAATTSELRRWAREKRIAAGKDWEDL